MWKKFGVVMLALCGTIMVALATNQVLNAETPVDGAGDIATGSTVTGRIGSLQRGDRMYLYTDGYQMQLVNNQIEANPETYWFAMSTQIDDKVDVIYDAKNARDDAGGVCPWSTIPSTSTNKNNSFECSNLREVVNRANASLTEKDRKLIADRKIYVYDSIYHTIKDESCSIATCFPFTRIYNGPINKLFIPNNIEMSTQRNNILSAVTAEDRNFSSPWIGAGVHTSSSSTWIQYVGGNQEQVDISSPASIRYSAYLNLENVVFSASQGSGDTVSKVTSPVEKSPLYTSEGSVMKVRFLNTSLKAELKSIEDDQEKSISTIAKGGKVNLRVNANSNANSDGTNTISLIITDKEGNFVYYDPIGTTKDGEQLYELDTTDYAVGEYNIAVVNEVYNTKTTAPSESSAISTSIPFTIVKAHSISYEAKPQAQTTYEYNKNVKEEDKVGELTVSDGVYPLTLSIVTDPNHMDHANDYLNFELSSTILSEASSAPLDINIKAKDAPDIVNGSLKAGDYYFCINAVDANGQPVPATTADVNLTVNKTTPEIKFTKNDKGEETVLGSTTEVGTIKQHAKHNNNDILYKNTGGGDDYDIIYTQEKGTSGLLNTLPQTSTNGGEISLTVVANKAGSITLKAHLNETDNYVAADTTKTIIVNLGLTAEYVEDKTNIKAGSTEAKPSITAPIGHIVIKGGTSPFSYTFKSGENKNGSFHLDKSEGKIYVDSSVGETGLAPGSYPIEVTVSDATKPTAQTTNVTKTITISEADLQGVAFEDPDTTDKVAGDSITRTYDPSLDGGSFHTKLMETADGSLTGTMIEYSVVSNPNDVIEYVNKTADGYANFKVKKTSNSSEKGNILIKAHVSGGAYGNVGKDISIPVNVVPYKQEIEFAQANPYPLSNTAACTSIPATMKSGYWNQSEKNVIKYISGDQTKVTINKNGDICPSDGATGTVIITAELTGDDNYTTTKATIQINLVGEVSLSYTENAPLIQAVNETKQGDTGNALSEVEFGTINVSGGLDEPYAIQIKDEDYANSYFELSQVEGNQRASKLKLKNGVSITADILKAGMDAGVIVQDTTNKDQYNWTMQVLPDTGEEPQEIIVHIIGADPVLTFEKETNGNLTTTYATDGTIDLSVKRGNDVLSTGIKVEGSTGYQTFIGSLAGLTTDAQVNGIDIKKANCDNENNVISGKSIKVTPSAEASDGYKSGKGIETPIIIKKANHPKVDFIEPDTILQSGISSIDKGFTGIEAADDHLTITPKEPTIWEGTTFEKIDSGDGTEPSVTIKPNGYEGTISYIVNGGGTDNYKPIKNEEIDLFFSSTGGITYRPIKITYGDATKKVIDYITDGDKENNTYTYAPIEGSTYVDEENNEILTLDDTTSTITTKQAGKTKVNVTRRDTEGNILTQAIPVEVIPKEITLTYASNTIYAGEELPNPSFIEPETGVLVGNDTIADFPIPAEAAHYKGTEIITDSKTIGTYETKGNWNSDELEFEVNPNYKVTIKAGKLIIKKDSTKDNWYHLENPEGSTVSKDDWHNYYVDVVLDTATGSAGTYDQISNTETFTNANKTSFTVTKEDENTEDVYFRIDPNEEAEHKGAITSTQTTVKIDMTKPIITRITGYPVNTDGLSVLINNLTFGLFYKPGVDVTIETNDPQPAGESGRVVSGVKKVTYKIYTLDDKGGFDSTQTPQTGEGSADTKGKISFKINDVGKYRVCAIAEDNAKNPSKESCSDLNVKKLDVDEDGDDNPDYRDSDGDGCPDLNIILGKDTAGNPEDKDGNKIKLNVAEKGKNYPYMNIDSDGDGIADLNIDTDHDNKPDLNLVIMDESKWKPNVCVPIEKLKDYTQPIEYCTGTDAKASINMDIVNEDGDSIPDGIPDINIETTGDMKPDFNIDLDDDGKADVNIGNVHIEWNPEKEYNYEGFQYDTMLQDIPRINVDSDDDSRPDLNIDLNNDGEPDLNIDADGDNIPETNIDSTGDGKPDVNIDTNDDGEPDENIIMITEWIPEKDVDGTIKYDTMSISRQNELKDNGIVVVNPDGTFLPNCAIKVNDISDSVDVSIKGKIEKIAGEQEIKKVYDIKYMENNITKQPNGKVKVKIPIDPLIKNAKVMVEREDGSFEEIAYKVMDGFYVFETDYIGKVSVVGDNEETEKVANKKEPTVTKPKTSVKGNYTLGNQTVNGMGGANTGDENNLLLYFFITGIAVSILSILIHKQNS